MKLLLCLATTLLLNTCASYEAGVASRSDSLSGYGKDGAYGGGYTHTVTYR